MVGARNQEVLNHVMVAVVCSVMHRCFAGLIAGGDTLTIENTIVDIFIKLQ
jgi:hypothetical protein